MQIAPNGLPRVRRSAKRMTAMHNETNLRRAARFGAFCMGGGVARRADAAVRPATGGNGKIIFG
jgi:hypothetical protein